MGRYLRYILITILGAPFFVVVVGYFAVHTILFFVTDFLVSGKDRMPLRVYFCGAEEYGVYPE